MGNADTVKAINANLAAILTAQGFLFEDTSTDRALEDGGVFCALRGPEESFDTTHGQKPSYSEVSYALLIRFSDIAPATTRDKIADWTQKVRAAVTVNALNIGAFSASKLVSRVDHGRSNITEYNPPITEITYPITVRYRET